MFFRSGSKAGIEAVHAKRLRLQLSLLDAANSPADMKACPDGACIDCGKILEGHWAVWIDKNWRLTFAFADAERLLLLTI